MALPVPALVTPTRTVSPDSVVTVASPPVNLAVPPDGRLNGYGITATVAGVATGTKLGQDKPSQDQHLWAFGITYQIDHNSDLRSAPAPTATLVEQNTRIPLPRLAGTSGTSYYLASVSAKAADVVLEISSAGYAQDFSLIHMAREGPQPVVLYRDPIGWATMQPLSAQATLPVPAASGLNLDFAYTLNSLNLTFTASAARLSWFGPDTPSDQPAKPAEAWLTLTLRQTETHTDTDCPNGCAQIGLAPTLAANQITLTLPGAPPQPATLLDPGSSPPGTILNGIYAWQVPATTTAGTVTISPANIALTQQNTTDTFPLTVPGAASLPFTFPAPSPPSIPLGSTTSPAHYPQTPVGKPTNKANGNVFPMGSGSGGSDAGPIAASVGGTAALVAAVLLAAVLVRRRRRPAPSPSPATQPPPAQDFWPATSAQPHPPPAPVRTDPAPAPDHPQTIAPDLAPADHLISPTADASEQPPAAENPPPEPQKVPPASPPVPSPPSGPLRVSVLGPVQIEGWAETPSRRAVTEIVTYLACHPDRRVTTDRLRAAVAAGTDSDIDEGSLRSYLSHTRRALGANRLPDNTTKEGYRLQDVVCDWVRFQQLTARAEREPDRSEALLGEALALIRGDPFADGCAWAETELLPETIRSEIAKAATTLAERTVETKPEIAERAAAIGLAAHPTDEPLSILALRAAAPRGHLQAAWGQLKARWAGVDLPADLTTLHNQLAAGER